MDIFKIAGIVGLVLISIGVITQKKESEDLIYIFGGVCLLVYSSYIGDLIFIVLQIIFIISAVFHFLKTRRAKGAK
ncbi:hypothetical protein HOB10_04665 [Candidatus Parcubacteria bacterium]|jgi:hypothetical protein|nr:hypothetical protein [Candidatus Parcubacteria bacterium]